MRHEVRLGSLTRLRAGAAALTAIGLSLACTLPTTTSPPERHDAGAPPPEAGRPSGDESNPADDVGTPPPPLQCPPVHTPFTPPPFVPATPYQGHCTSGDIDAFISACVAPGTSCVAWSDDNRAGFAEGGAGSPCGNCLFSPRTGNNGAVWLDSYGLFIPNIGACIALLQPSSGLACAEAFDALDDCDAQACEYCMDLMPNDYDDCVTAAEATSCARYTGPQMDDCVLGPKAAQCLASPGGAAEYVFIANLICGAPPGGPKDAGGD